MIRVLSEDDRIRLMISQTRLFDFVVRAAYAAAALGVLLAAARFFALSGSDGAPTGDVPEWGGFAGAPDKPLSGVSSVFVVERRSGTGPLSNRFRLAGTVLGGNLPMAVIDDKATVCQRVVHAGQEVAEGSGIIVAGVLADRVLLSGPNGTETLFLERAGSLKNQTSSARTGAASVLSADAASAFGGREVFPNRWEFSRDALMNYYSELRDEPERLLSVFDSMDPVYENDEAGRPYIDGYVVDVEGESKFFEAAGLKNGDIVRAVNSVPMTNRRKAEAFISDFVLGGGGMYVLEVERDGEITKFVYEIK